MQNLSKAQGKIIQILSKCQKSKAVVNHCEGTVRLPSTLHQGYKDIGALEEASNYDI